MHDLWVLVVGVQIADDSRGEVDIADPEAPDLPATEPGVAADGERETAAVL